MYKHLLVVRIIYYEPGWASHCRVTNRFRFPVGQWCDFFPHRHCVQTGFGSRPTSYTIWGGNLSLERGSYNILLEFGIPKRLVRLIKMCLNESYNRVRVGKSLMHSYSEWPETMRCPVTIAFQFCFRICLQESRRKSSWFGVKWDPSAVDLVIDGKVILDCILGK
jgi:hypothetical protein